MNHYRIFRKGSGARGNSTHAFNWLLAVAFAVVLSGCVREEETLAGGDDNSAADPGPGSSDPGNTGGGGTGGGGTGGTPPPPDDPPDDMMPPPVDPDPPMDPPPPTDQAIFEQTLYPHLTDANNFCVGCHGATQIPTFAVDDPASAYSVIITQQKVDLNNPEMSRVYLRASVDRHNCGGDAVCDRIAADFLAAIQDWAMQASANTPPPDGGAQKVVSATTNFAAGMDGGAARADGAAIALFTFSEGTGTTTVDTGGVGNPITLQLQGTEWVEGGGIRNVSGKAQASLDDSRKLFDMITAAGEYSVEAWLIPDNIDQDGPARIVSYSQDTAVRNFTMGQNANYYQLRNRSAGTGANGTPALEALDPPVDTVLQHVVMTFHPDAGRKVFVNGQLGAEENAPDTLDWLDDQIFVLGNEVTDNRLWRGVFKLVAIHNKALDSAEVQQNFDAGAGSFITLRFDVSAVVGANAYIDMQASQIDPGAYVFAKPVMVTDMTSVAVKNIRIAVNDTVPVAAQVFRRLDTTVLQSPVELSPLGAVIPVALGPEMDQFHLEFEVLGAQLGLAETIAPPTPPVPAPDVPEADSGVRTFSQIHDTMSGLTGISQGNGAVADRYQQLRDSLPATADMLAFGTAQQIAIHGLAKTYCGQIVTNGTRCSDFFGQCAVDGNAKDQVADTLYDRFVGVNLVNQPDRVDVNAEIVRTIDDLGCANGCTGAEAETVLQATCTAVLSSAAVTLN